MSVSSGVITAPVSISDVKQVLGASSNDLGTLCTHPNINMWSKRKPTHYPTTQLHINKLSNAELKEAQCGISLGSIEQLSFDTLKTNADNGTEIYEYKTHGSEYPQNFIGRPYGTSQSPYRLADFDGYDHNAELGFGIIPTDEVVIAPSDVSSNKPITFRCTIDDEEDSSIITFGDIIGVFASRNLYYGVRIYKNGIYTTEVSNEQPCVYADGSVNPDYSYATYSSKYSSTTQMTVYHFLKDSEGNIYIPFPDTTKETFVVRVSQSASPVQCSSIDIAASNHVSTASAVIGLDYHGIDDIIIHGSNPALVFRIDLTATSNATIDLTGISFLINSVPTTSDYTIYYNNNVIPQSNFRVDANNTYTLYIAFNNAYNGIAVDNGMCEISLYDKKSNFVTQTSESVELDLDSSTIYIENN